MIQKISLFTSKRDFILTFFILLFISTYSLLIEFNNYKQLVRFDSHILNATLQKQYQKTKFTKKGKEKTYYVLKFKAQDGSAFYTSQRKKIDAKVGQNVRLEIWAGKISFYEYLSSFYAFSKVLQIYQKPSMKEKLNGFIADEHQNQDITSIYQALFTAKPLDRKIQKVFSSLGISHLIAISGFHLGVLSALLFFLFKYPYKFLQNRYFPYRSYKVDSFIIITLFLLSYLLFLDSPASLLRAFGMLIVGFVLYDRGIKVISMQTLFITILLLLAFFPRLVFSLGFYLSVSGVFYIFLFLIYFSDLSKKWQFILLPFWVYFLMLPYSLIIFGNFSIYHALSILWTSLFTLFYPLSIFLHLLNFGDLFDVYLLKLMQLGSNNITMELSYKWLILYVGSSIGAIYKRVFLYFTLALALFTFIYSIYQIT